MPGTKMKRGTFQLVSLPPGKAPLGMSEVHGCIPGEARLDLFQEQIVRKSEKKETEKEDKGVEEKKESLRVWEFKNLPV